jgi:hypothetical protein
LGKYHLFFFFTLFQNVKDANFINESIYLFQTGHYLIIDLTTFLKIIFCSWQKNKFCHLILLDKLNKILKILEIKLQHQNSVFKFYQSSMLIKKEKIYFLNFKIKLFFFYPYKVEN